MSHTRVAGQPPPWWSSQSGTRGDLVLSEGQARHPPSSRPYCFASQVSFPPPLLCCPHAVPKLRTRGSGSLPSTRLWNSTASVQTSDAPPRRETLRAFQGTLCSEGGLHGRGSNPEALEEGYKSDKSRGWRTLQREDRGCEGTKVFSGEPRAWGSSVPVFPAVGRECSRERMGAGCEDTVGAAPRTPALRHWSLRKTHSASYKSPSNHYERGPTLCRAPTSGGVTTEAVVGAGGDGVMIPSGSRCICPPIQREHSWPTAGTTGTLLPHAHLSECLAVTPLASCTQDTHHTVCPLPPCPIPA